jgi:hypothetical protein
MAPEAAARIHHTTVIRGAAALTVFVFSVAAGETVRATAFTVTTTADGDAGSLRSALSLAQNCTGGPHTIVFDVPAATLTAGVALIRVGSPLPTVYCPGTTIDGTTQTSNQGNSNNVILGTGGTVGTGPDGRPDSGDEPFLPRLDGPEVEIDGTGVDASLWILFADRVTIRGLSIHGGGFDLTQNAERFGNLEIQGGTGIVIEKNVLGAPARSFSSPGGNYGNLIRLAGGSGITIRQNLMGFNQWRAILVADSSVSDLTIEQNEIAGSYIGLSLGHPGPAGALKIDSNLIRDLVDNGTDLVRVGASFGQTVGSARITNNTFRNTGYGLFIGSSRPVLFEHNIVSGGPNDALYTSNIFFPLTITQNSIFGNGLGIDLVEIVGVTPNDGKKDDRQYNAGMDYPIFTVATLSGAALTIAGYVGAKAAGDGIFSNAVVEVFKADNVPPNQNGEIVAGDGLSVPHGEGRIYLGTVASDSLGRFQATLPVPAGMSLSVGDAVTATATDTAGNTSEFGPNATLLLPPTATPTPTLLATPTSTPTAPIAAGVPAVSLTGLVLLAVTLGGVGWLVTRRN